MVRSITGFFLFDTQEGISKITWRRGDKKVLLIERSDADSPELQFVYNPFGQRILKITRTRSGGDYTDPDEWKYTYYAYDANGTVMGTYDIQILEEDYKVTIAELNIYGAGRIGVIEPERVLYDDVDPIDDEGYGADGIFWNALGRKKYELTNYLGNVNAVVTDRKMVSGGASVYEAVVILKADYYPFGMTMPGREYQTDAYRYAYNGMEQDPEVKGNGNSYTTEFRQYDPRLGRWLSLDPLMVKYPAMSPYTAFNNNPISFVDPFGLEGTADYVDIKTGKVLGNDGIADGKVFYIDKEEWTKLNCDYKQYYGSQVFQNNAVSSYGAKEEPDDETRYQLLNRERFETIDKQNAYDDQQRSSKVANPAMVPKKKEVPPPAPPGAQGFSSIEAWEMRRNEEILERELKWAEIEKSGLDQWMKIGQGLTYSPEAATSVFVPEYTIAKIGVWANRARTAYVANRSVTFYRAVSYAEMAEATVSGFTWGRIRNDQIIRNNRTRCFQLRQIILPEF